MLLAQIPVFNPKSDQARGISDLFVVTLAIGGGIILLVIVLVIFAMVKFRHQKEPDGKAEPKQIHGNRKWEIGWTVAPAVLLAVLFVPTLIVMGASDPSKPGVPDLEIIGHQFWWEYRFPKEGVVTANDLHLPVGQQVLARLESTDVIHDFWVPQLGRKMDLVPGKPNYLALQSDTTGIFNGACSEYCGAAHAWMLIRVQVEPADQFEAWLQAQKVIPPAPAAGSQAAQGQQLFDHYSCATCHSIAGTDAKGQVGPNLTHVAGRPTLGSGVLDNTPANLLNWIKDAPAIKPGVKMPSYTQLRNDELQALVAYLEGLK